MSDEDSMSSEIGIGTLIATYMMNAESSAGAGGETYMNTLLKKGGYYVTYYECQQLVPDFVQ